MDVMKVRRICLSWNALEDPFSCRLIVQYPLVYPPICNYTSSIHRVKKIEKAKAYVELMKYD